MSDSTARLRRYIHFREQELAKNLETIMTLLRLQEDRIHALEKHLKLCRCRDCMEAKEKESISGK